MIYVGRTNAFFKINKISKIKEYISFVFHICTNVMYLWNSNKKQRLII